MAKLKHKITLYCGGVEATFRLNDSEYEEAKHLYENKQRYKFAWFAWADYSLTASKRKRFNNIFDYHKGDFCVFELS